jgi:cytoskeletal protein CcmA (bactofilin family)
MWGHNTVRRADNSIDPENFTVLGKDVRIKGAVHLEGTVRMNCCFDGEIYSKGVLIVGEHAVIKGTINATSLINSGKIKGIITATEKVQLLKPAVLIGDVHAPSFSMEEGAYIQGQVDMGVSPWTDKSSEDTASVHDLATHRKKQTVQAPNKS